MLWPSLLPLSLPILVLLFLSDKQSMWHTFAHRVVLPHTVFLGHVSRRTPTPCPELAFLRGHNSISSEVVDQPSHHFLIFVPRVLLEEYWGFTTASMTPSLLSILEQFSLSLLPLCPISCSRHLHSTSCHWFSSHSTPAKIRPYWAVLCARRYPNVQAQALTWLGALDTANRKTNTRSHHGAGHHRDRRKAHVLVRIEVKNLTLIAHGTGQSQLRRSLRIAGHITSLSLLRNLPLRIQCKRKYKSRVCVVWKLASDVRYETAKLACCRFSRC